MILYTYSYRGSENDNKAYNNVNGSSNESHNQKETDLFLQRFTDKLSLRIREEIKNEMKVSQISRYVYVFNYMCIYMY
jgi:hypothetical protein